MGVFDRVAAFIRGPRPEQRLEPPIPPVVAALGPRAVVEATPWQSLGGVGAASIRHVISRDDAGYYVQREDDDEWSPVRPVGPFAALGDARHRAELDFQGLRASWASHVAQSRQPEPEPWWSPAPERDPYVPTPQEQAEIDAWEQADWEQDERERAAQGVETVQSGDWYSYAPGQQAREHIGRSGEGWHYAVETSPLGTEREYPSWHPPETSWSRAYPTREQAEASVRAATLHPELAHDDEGHEL